MTVDPTNNQPPNAEPTPESPAPIQTSPVTPTASESSQTTATPQAPATPPIEEPTRKSPKGLLAAIIAAALIVAALAFLVLSPWSPLVSSAPSGPQLFVGQHTYVQACSTLNREVIGKELAIKLDTNKENVSETTAYDPANSKDKKVDLTKQSGAESVYSSCSLKLDRKESTFVSVTATIEQFTDQKKAEEVFKTDKQSASDAKTLPSYSDNSYYAKPRAPFTEDKPEEATSLDMQSKVLHKNMLISLTVPLDKNDADGSKTAPKVDKVVKDLIARIDKGEGDKAKNFDGVNALKGHAFTDSCRAVNYAKVAKAMGSNTEFYGQSISSNQLYAPDNNSGKTPNQMISACTFSFRTQTEIDSAKKLKTDKNDTFSLKSGQAYAEKFPHFLSLQIAVTESKESAQKYLKSAKEKMRAIPASDGQTTKAEDITLGDGGVRVTLRKIYPVEAGQPETVSAGQLYYVANGASIYVFSTTYVQQEKPFKSETKEVTTDQFKKIYKELAAATKRAN